MASSNHFEQEANEKIEKTSESSPNELSFLPVIQNGSFLSNGNYNFENRANSSSNFGTSPTSGHLPPSSLFPTLTNAVEDEFTDIFYIINPTNGLEEAGPSYLHIEELQTIEEETNVVPAKKQKKEMSLYEETLLKEFSAERSVEKKLLQEEHDMKMKLWGLELQASQQEHVLKMKILKEKLEKIQHEKEILQRKRNAKYLGKFSSGPI